MGLLSNIEDRVGGLLGFAPGSAPQPVQTPDPSQGAQPYRPGFLDTLGEVLFNGMAPADAGMHLRQQHYNAMNMDRLSHLLPQLPVPVQIAAAVGGPEAVKEVLANYAPQNRKPGEQTDYWGGQGQPGGNTASTDTYGIEPTSGKPTQAGPGIGGVAVLGPSLGGGYKIDANGVQVSDRTGYAGGVSVPQKVDAGQTLLPVTPGAGSAVGGSPVQVAGPGLYAADGSQTAPQGPGAPPAPQPASITAGGSPAPAPTPRNTALSAQAASQILSSIIPGAKITSGYRTPEHNAAVGGVPNSLHTRGQGQAIDFVPPPGFDINQFRAGLQQRGLPATELLNEGDHIHWGYGPKGRGTQVAAAAPPAAPGQATVGAPLARGGGYHLIAPGTNPALPPGAVGQVSPTGETSVVPGTGYGPDQIFGLRRQVLDSDAYKNYQSANDAYGAMVSAASQPNGGMRAYALRDTFARLINPGAVARVGTIQAIEEAQGVPANVKAYLMNLKGDGNVPSEVAQQILDVSQGFLASHYKGAKALNDSNTDFAQRHGINPADVTAPMEGAPGRVVLGALPPKNQLVPGQIYVTRRGPATWTGATFRPFGKS